MEEGSDVDGGGEDEEQEWDEDVDERRYEAPPARKKPRTSVEDDEGHREEEVVARKLSRKGRSRQVAEEEEETEPPPPPRTRRSSAKPPSSKTTKTTHSSRRPLRVESDVEEEEEQEEKTKEEDKEDAIPISDDEDTLPIQSGGGRKVASGNPIPKQSQPSSKSLYKSSKSAKTSEQEDAVLTPRPLKTAPVTPRRDPTPDQQATADEEEDDLDGFDQEYKATPRRGKRQDGNKNSSPSQASRTPKRAAPVAEEEERSLLEPIVRPQTQSQPPPMEEVKGPKTRLVIHKMVLVNFKSYAGRQEIGPFHKVRLSTFAFGVVILILFVASHSRQSLVPMAQASQTRSTRCCSCSDTVHQKCVRVNSQS
jgi:structural maintenance of chromosome 4